MEYDEGIESELNGIKTASVIMYSSEYFRLKESTPAQRSAIFNMFRDFGVDSPDKKSYILKSLTGRDIGIRGLTLMEASLIMSEPRMKDIVEYLIGQREVQGNSERGSVQDQEGARI